MSILFSGDTNIGRKRKTNQDSICLYPEKNFFIVADGMGGHNGGDIASQMAVKVLPEFINNNDTLKPQDLLTEAVKHTNLSIFQHGSENEELKGMGTTISGIMLQNGHAHIVNVGDSRGYLIKDKKLFQITKDHYLVQEKVSLGIYDREAAKKDPQKNILTRTVGFDKELDVDTFDYEYGNGDLFLFCSDGLHGKVCDKNILEIILKNLENPDLKTQEKLDNATKQLIHQANANGGQDNISVVLIFV